MIPLSSTELKPLEFSENESSKKVNSSTARIGWLHSLSDVPGAKFDLTIKDALGRVMLHKKDCGNETEKYGELINLPVLIGEELEVMVDNIKGAKSVKVFLN